MQKKTETLALHRTAPHCTLQCCTVQLSDKTRRCFGTGACACACTGTGTGSGAGAHAKAVVKQTALADCPLSVRVNKRSPFHDSVFAFLRCQWVGINSPSDFALQFLQVAHKQRHQCQRLCLCRHRHQCQNTFLFCPTVGFFDLFLQVAHKQKCQCQDQCQHLHWPKKNWLS